MQTLTLSGGGLPESHEQPGWCVDTPRNARRLSGTRRTVCRESDRHVCERGLFSLITSLKTHRSEATKDRDTNASDLTRARAGAYGGPATRTDRRAWRSSGHCTDGRRHSTDPPDPAISDVHVDAGDAGAAAALPWLRSGARVPANRHQRDQADRAVGLFRMPDVRVVRLPRTDAEAAGRHLDPTRPRAHPPTNTRPTNQTPPGPSRGHRSDGLTLNTM